MTASSLASPVARYWIERKLGEGATGAVYLVRDRETGEQLALKKLFRMDAKSVLRLKREFRSLQALNHPHIVQLYDMGQAEDAWFLTMEYLEGVDLSTYLDAEDGDASVSATFTTSSTRLLPAFQQLARGVQALHDAGMLHRDLKPSNVLVVDDRVVMLDFGLVRELDASAATLTEAGSAAGTPAYMSPEQALARPLTAASDWYAFGVMLYEAVSGSLPFDGPIMQLLKAKLEVDPTPLLQVVPGVPRWLNELCMQLLQRDPSQRPTGSEVLAQLGLSQPSASRAIAPMDYEFPTEAEHGRTAPSLVGREYELGQLWSALSRVEDGSSVVLHVRAPSGSGKSALIEHFLDLVERPHAGAKACETLVLRSRCYELEAMPFKALDGVMDALTRHLVHLDDVEVAHLLPADVALLAKVFPVLQRLRAVNRLAGSARAVHDAVQHRLRAESALRTLLDNLALRSPLVVWIDDLQWGDLDSARILRRWLLQPSAAPVLFLFSYRSDEVGTSSCLQELLHEDGESDTARVPRDFIDLGPLEPEDVHALCEARLDTQIPARAELIDRVVQEAHGSPFFAAQLIALAEAKCARGDTDLHTLSLDHVVAHISAMLADDAKRVLAVLAVAGRPMPPKLLLSAAAVNRGARALIHDLRALNLVRTRDVAGQRKLEIYHDQVRERVQLAMSAEDCRLFHQNLFDVLEHGGEADPDWLHSLALGAGQSGPALHYGQAAAARAAASLAFERAASLYRSCVALAPPERAGEVWGELAAALARSGRGVAAAEASLEAAKHVPAHERAIWTQRAAAHFLRCGHFARGEELVREVLEAHAIDVPTSDAGLIAAIVWERARIKLLGTRDVVRSEGHSAELLGRYDVLASLSLSTHTYDPLRAGLFQARALRCALEAGEPKRLAEALRLAAITAAGSGASRESDNLLARAEAISARLADPDRKKLLGARASRAFLCCQFSDVLEPAAEAERLYRLDAQSDPTGNYFHRLQLASARLATLYNLGQYAALSTHLQSVLDEAVAHDVRSQLLVLTYVQTCWEQLVGKGSTSRARLDAQIRELPEGRFGILHALHMSAVMHDASWSGDYASARAYLEATWARFLRSPLRRSRAMAVMSRTEHARFVLNEYVALRKGNPFARVEEDVSVLTELDRSGPHSLHGISRHFRARVAWLRGDRRQAIEQLRMSLKGSGLIDLPHPRARVQYALGVMLGDGEGAELRSAAEARIRDLGVVDVAGDLDASYPELAELRQ